MMVLVTGASSSGKSAFAEKCLMDMGEKTRIYAATMIAWDEECRERIRRHRAMRKEKKFETIECPVDLETLTIPEKSAVLLECMSNLAANELYREDMDAGADISVRCPKAEERILRGLYEIKSQAEDFVVVTNEVFSDGGIYDRETKGYQRLLGRLNRELFCMADEAWEVVMGIPVCLKGEEKAACRRDDKGVHMKLIVGGVHQGKKEAALKILGRETETEPGAVADGERDSFEAALKGKLVLNFHEYIRRFSSMEPEDARSKMHLFLEQLKEENPGVTVVSDEIGCGIVPVDREDRLWRDLLGEALRDLAGESDEVYRVICGCIQTLKGGIK